MRALLDVNVLIALLDPDHVHHRSATRWLVQNLHSGWASCPLTQNGCIRIMSQPAYPNGAPPGRIASRLREAMHTPAHEFWPDDLDGVASTALDWTVILSSRQLTDAYLLALAVRRGGRFVTLDRGVPLAAVEGAQPQSLVVLD
ncbi:MAG: TA system VapC family ribonuclease toxin [Rubrivivax sp.]|nr:TA system VapC family ribonuclease toxin [Rubrivivax sp.]